MVDCHGRRCVVSADGRGVEGRDDFRGRCELKRRKDVAELLFKFGGARDPHARCGHLLAKQQGHLFVGAVLQQAGEQEVAGFKKFEVELVFHLALRQQAGCFEVEQGRCYHEEA